MDFPRWAEVDGEKLANIILEALKEKETMNIYDIFIIYDTCGFPVMRKTEGVAWRILNPLVEQFEDENGLESYKLKGEMQT